MMLECWTDSDAFERVLAAARNGDEVAFARLWRWLNPGVLRWLQVVVPNGAEDVCSEVWCSVARNIESFVGGEDEFRGWVFVTARRRAIDAARRGARQPATARLDGVDPADAGDASTATIETEDVEAALAVLRDLPAQQAEVLALRIVAGLSVAETAAVVGKSEGSVRILCHRGLRTLAGRMDRTDVLEGVTQ